MISQNCDGLHRRSGLSTKGIAFSTLVILSFILSFLYPSILTIYLPNFLLFPSASFPSSLHLRDLLSLSHPFFVPPSISLSYLVCSPSRGTRHVHLARHEACSPSRGTRRVCLRAARGVFTFARHEACSPSHGTRRVHLRTARGVFTYVSTFSSLSSFLFPPSFHLSLPPYIALFELHGNSNVEKCSKCKREYLRDFRVRTARGVFNHATGQHNTAS